MKVAVVVLNWNGKAFLQKFLPSVVAHNSSFAEIIIADNNSTDDSVDFIRSTYPSMRIICNEVNGGFAKGYNDALRQVDAEYYVLLNSDVEVTEGWIEHVIALMDSDHQIAACQPKIRSFLRKKYFEYAGAAGGYIDKYGFPFCRGRILEELEEDKGQYDDQREIFWATGACLFIRSECYHKVGGFDEDFFAHMEEIDLCWRLKNIGYKIMNCPRSVVYHVGGGTLNKTSPLKTYLNFRNNLFLLCKNHPPRLFFLKLMFRMWLDGVAGFMFFFTGKWRHLWAILKAHYSFYVTIFRTLRKRRALKAQVKEYTQSAVYLHSIVADFYIRKNRTFTSIDKPGRFLWSDKAFDGQTVGIHSKP
jgi:GT2 family glycosyltransferase